MVLLNLHTMMMTAQGGYSAELTDPSTNCIASKQIITHAIQAPNGHSGGEVCSLSLLSSFLFVMPKAGAPKAHHAYNRSICCLVLSIMPLARRAVTFCCTPPQ